MAADRLRQRGDRSHRRGDGRGSGAQDRLRFQRRQGLRRRAPRRRTAHARGVRGAVPPARTRRGQRPRAQADRLERAERLAACAQRPLAAAALEAVRGAEPGHRFCLGALERCLPVAARLHRARRRGGRGRCGEPVHRRPGSARPHAGAAAERALLECRARIQCRGRADRARLEAAERGSKALDRHRLQRPAHARRLDHRLAGGGAGERLSRARLARREALENGVRGGACGGQAQLRLPARAFDSLCPPGDKAAVRRRIAQARAFRVLTLDRGFLVCRRGRRAPRPASALAASRAE